MAPSVATDRHLFRELLELDEEGQGRLAVLRMRCSRATERAQLADDLADQVAGLRTSRRT